MKTRVLWPVALGMFVMVGLSSCTVEYKARHSHAGAMPPGQAKKITGSQSAAPYAPGQQKKHKSKKGEVVVVPIPVPVPVPSK